LVAPGGESEKPGRQRLRPVGIRGATDLERVWPAPGHNQALRRKVAAALTGDPGDTAAVEALLRTYRGDVNLAHVGVFRHFDWLDDDVVEAAEHHEDEPERPAA